MEQKNETDTIKNSPVPNSQVTTTTSTLTRRSLYSSSEMEEWQERFGKFTENQKYIQDRLEYPRHGNEPGLVLIFNQETFENGSSKRDGSFKDVEDIVTCLTRLGFNMNTNHIFTNLTNDEIFTNIDSMASSVEKYSLLFLIFWGYSKDDGGFTLDNNSTLSFVKTWSLFLTSRNMNFREIPKVFLFNVIESFKTNQPDKADYVEPGSPYEVPNESDLLIIYKHNKDVRESIGFVEELAETLEEFGKTEDLCTVVSIIDTTPCSRPVLISTMLKKLYMIPSELRGHYLSYEINHEITMKEMKKIDNLLTDVKKEKIQTSPSFLRKMKNKISSSFRSKPAGNTEKSKPDGMVQKEKIIEHNACSTAFKKASRSITPRTSIDRNAIRRSSVVKKISIDERKPWKP